MKRLAGSAFLLSGFLACLGNDPTSGTSGPPDGSDGGLLDGAVDGSPTPCATPARCSDDGASLVTCHGPTPCGLGCDVANARCKSIAPSGAAGQTNASEATAAVVLDAASTYWFDTSTGLISFRDETSTPTGAPVRLGGNGVVSGIGFASVTQSDGSKVGVWSFRSLTVGKQAIVKVYGADALVLVGEESLVVDGAIDVRGDCAKNVPGPGAPSSAGSPRHGKMGEGKFTEPRGYKYLCGGGGGGGNGTAGGAGAWAYGENMYENQPRVSVQSLGGLRGSAREKTLIDEPLLVGGGSGGTGGEGYYGDGFANGGPGGGAVQLVSSGTLTISGSVDAGGCGGKRGWGGSPPINTQRCRGAGGGGAGGSILLEAPKLRVTATGRVLANGGGGGGGTTSNSSNNDPPQNTDGASNFVDGSRAAGGKADTRRGASCGPGQDGSVPADQAQSAAEPCSVGDISAAAAGGGGGAGTIAVRTADTTFMTDDGGIVSPLPARSIASVK